MRLLRFLVRYSPRSITVAVLASLISGACNAGLLAALNVALKGGGFGTRGLLWACVALCIFLPLSRFLTETLLARIGQAALLDLRLKICHQILVTPLRRLEELGVSRLLTILTEDLPVIANNVAATALLCVNVSIVLGGLIYLGLLSWVVFLAVLGFFVVGIVTYQFPSGRALRLHRLARQETEALFGHFRSLTAGAKELKLNRRRREAFVGRVLEPTAVSSGRHNVAGAMVYAAAGSWGQVLVYIVIITVLFVLPGFYEVGRDVLTGYTITLLYLMTPLQVIMNIVPNLGRASVALQRVEDLGGALAARGMERSEPAAPLKPVFEKLELRGVTHTYWREGEESSFILGPIDFQLRPGELVFVVGANGGGKTTLAKLLTGLYVPESGEIRLNNRVIGEGQWEYYREHFSMVFSDFFLFDSLLGLEHPSLDEQALGYLVSLQLDHKVKVRDGAFSTTELSQGQRKRLALLTAYLEDRPIYVFDEWAADQDPHFKSSSTSASCPT
jgi:putative ATP-binding cassette transporter